MNSQPDTRYASQMARALVLAEMSPAVGRNPRVGCVLLDSTGAIVAEGYHHGAGSPHAEVEALEAARAMDIDTAGLTAVVTLEPCNHQGLTGPCAEALISAGITRVVYGASDPGDTSSGGATRLQNHGVEVISGVLAEQSEDLNARWFFAMRHQRPFVTAKWAQSLDGRIAAVDLTSQWITGAQSRERVHRERSEHGVIMVGTTTALVDNPSLTARTPDGGLAQRQPHAVVVGRRDIPADYTIRSHPGGFRQIAKHDPAVVLRELFDDGYRSVYLEGGATLLSAFIQAGLVDEFHLTMGPLLLGGDKLAIDDLGVGTMTEAHRLEIDSVEKLGSDIWVVAHPAERATKGGS